MAREYQDGDTEQPTSGLIPGSDPERGEPSRTSSQHGVTNQDGPQVELRKLRFYDEHKNVPSYRAREMPYEANHKKIGQGAYATVYETTIRGGCYRIDEGLTTTGTKIARKEFSEGRAKEDFLAENRTCIAFQKTTAGFPQTIVTPLFSYAIKDEDGEMKYNIGFELAACDLKTWLSKERHFPNGKKSRRIANIHRMFKLSEGLKWLTNTITKTNGTLEYQKILHLDLHWKNILVFEDEEEEFIFKIGDFGNAKRVQGSEDRQDTRAATPAGFHGQFSAPESKPEETSDIWSFGCNLLLVLIYNYHGLGGINEFLASLLRNTSRDWFYDSKTGKASNETAHCIEHLRRHVKNHLDRPITLGILELLRDKILVPSESRLKIDRLVDELVLCLNATHTVEPHIVMERKHEEYRHCAHAPGGNFEMYFHDWQKHTMSVWIWNAGSASRLPFLEPIAVPQPIPANAKWVRIYPTSSCCGNQHICQVITGPRTLEVLLYQLPKDAMQPVMREFIVLTHIKNVTHVALAPSAKYIAIDEDLRLRLYDTEALLRNMKIIEQISGSGEIPEHLSLIGVNGDKLDLLHEVGGKRANFTERTVMLRFSPDNEYLYHAHRTVSSRCRDSSFGEVTVDVWCTKHRKRLLRFSLDKHKSNTDDLLIGLTPFHKDREVLVVTCYNRLSRYSFAEEDKNQPPVFIEPLEDKILAVLISPNDDFAVLLSQNGHLRVHIIDLGKGQLRYISQLNLSSTQMDTFCFDRHYDAASLIARETLLITYKNGQSVHITLQPALETWPWS